MRIPAPPTWLYGMPPCALVWIMFCDLTGTRGDWLAFTVGFISAGVVLNKFRRGR